MAFGYILTSADDVSTPGISSDRYRRLVYNIYIYIPGASKHFGLFMKIARYF